MTTRQSPTPLPWSPGTYSFAVTVNEEDPGAWFSLQGVPRGHRLAFEILRTYEGAELSTTSAQLLTLDETVVAHNSGYGESQRALGSVYLHGGSYLLQVNGYFEQVQITVVDFGIPESGGLELADDFGGSDGELVGRTLPTNTAGNGQAWGWPNMYSPAQWWNDSYWSPSGATSAGVVPPGADAVLPLYALGSSDQLKVGVTLIPSTLAPGAVLELGLYCYYSWEATGQEVSQAGFGARATVFVDSVGVKLQLRAVLHDPYGPLRNMSTLVPGVSDITVLAPMAVGTPCVLELLWADGELHAILDGAQIASCLAPSARFPGTSQHSLFNDVPPDVVVRAPQAALTDFALSQSAGAPPQQVSEFWTGFVGTYEAL